MAIYQKFVNDSASKGRQTRWERMKVLHSETIGWQLQQLGTLALNPFKLVTSWCSCSLGFLFGFSFDFEVGL